MSEVERQLEILRRYLSSSNVDSYRADRLTCSPIAGSYVRRVNRWQAEQALTALEQFVRREGVA